MSRYIQPSIYVLRNGALIFTPASSFADKYIRLPVARSRGKLEYRPVNFEARLSGVQAFPLFREISSARTSGRGQLARFIILLWDCLVAAVANKMMYSLAAGPLSALPTLARARAEPRANVA